MLDNGTVMNGKLIESPKSFQVACTVMTQIISSVASSQYGGQSVDIRHLGKYLRKSYNKYKNKLVEEFGDKIDDAILEQMAQDRLQDELRSGVQTIQYQINTLMTTNGQSPFVTLFLNLDPNDEYIEEMQSSWRRFSVTSRGHQKREGCVCDTCIPEAYLCIG